MHQTVLDWTKKIATEYPVKGSSILEVGAFNVNGSVKPFFTEAASYVGVDMRPGPGVDAVMNAQNLIFPDQKFDWVISTEMLEHDAAFWKSMKEMGRVLKPKGYLLITARGNGFPPHDFPADYWRFMPDAVPELLNMADCVTLINLPDPVPGFLALGQKR